MPNEIEFPGEEREVFERDAVAFPAIVDGELIECLISQEALQFEFGADRQTFREVFLECRGSIEAVAANMIRDGKVQGRELLIKYDDVRRR